MKRLRRILALVLCAAVLTLLTACKSDDLVLPPHQHVYTERHVDGNCTREGYTERSCACGDRIITYDGVLGDHVFMAIWEVDIPATAAHAGLKSRHCFFCDATVDPIELPKLDYSQGGDIDLPFGPAK